MKTWPFRRVFPLLLFVICLSACGTMPRQRSLYFWANYEKQVHAYLAGEIDREAQLQTMERDLEKIISRGSNVPPGFYAHLGLLSAELGFNEKAIAYFTLEKDYFPEAGLFMNIMLRRYEQ